MVKARLLGAVGIVAVVGGIVSVPAAQTPAKSLGFEVASVKVNKSGTGTMTPPPHDTYVAENFSLSMLIQRAYSVTASELFGGPGWLDAERFDVHAKFDGDRTSNEQMEMLRALLAERFHLQVHTETRALRAYRLVLNRSDGRLGPHLTPFTRDCASEPPVTREALIASRDSFVAPCGFAMVGQQSVTATAMEMSRFVTGLSNPTMGIDRRVIDGTGLAGRFDFDLRWAPLSSRTPTPSANDDAPSIFVALQEQLGLKLESVDGPREVVVIDHVEQLTEN